MCNHGKSDRLVSEAEARYWGTQGHLMRRGRILETVERSEEGGDASVRNPARDKQDRPPCSEEAVEEVESAVVGETRELKCELSSTVHVRQCRKLCDLAEIVSSRVSLCVGRAPNLSG